MILIKINFEYKFKFIFLIIKKSVEKESNKILLKIEYFKTIKS